ncbi:hypothetical protein [Mesonia sp. K7]|uniref:hypothetical protein n=1 Tax=Mesonia sp. K7 TaxID=2218606 RepID=UPI000DA9D75A|nr:hypothetical protein [Mesonia sp. K7]PZD77380.1 hypothetical protein DNG35_08660 [Mesonia sp. K7]
MELDEKDLGNKYNNLLTQVNVEEFLEHRDEIFNLDITLEGELLPKAKVTDLMGYTPRFFGFHYLVSQKVVDCLKEENVSKEKYRLLKVEIKGVDEDYYLLYVPWINKSAIIFSESLIYRTFDADSSDKEYFEIKNLNDYIELQDKEPFNSFDKVVLNSRYIKKHIISIQGITELFFSDAIVDKLLSNSITSLEIKNKTLLHFSEKDI